MDMNIVCARKDTAHRQNVSTERQAPLSAMAACEIELTDADLEVICGGLDLGSVGDAAALVLNSLGNAVST